MATPFEQTCASALELLRQLPRERAGVPDAREQVARFRRDRAAVPVRLYVDAPPGHAAVDYDLFVEHPEGGTATLAWQPDDGVPWAVAFKEHPSATQIVSVNGRAVTIQQALLFLRLIGQEQPRLMDAIVEGQLVLMALEADPPELSPAELQAEADAFRRAAGLRSAERTRRWLDEVGFSPARFREFILDRARHRKFVERVSDPHVQERFDADPGAHALILVARVRTVEARAQALADEARAHGLLAAAQRLAGTSASQAPTASLQRVRAGDLPGAVRAAEVGDVVGPVHSDGGVELFQVLDRQPPVLDAATRERLLGQIFREWVAGERERAEVRWHWL